MYVQYIYYMHMKIYACYKCTCKSLNTSHTILETQLGTTLFWGGGGGGGGGIMCQIHLLYGDLLRMSLQNLYTSLTTEQYMTIIKQPMCKTTLCKIIYTPTNLCMTTRIIKIHGPPHVYYTCTRHVQPSFPAFCCERG